MHHKTILIAEGQGPDQHMLITMAEKLGFKYIVCDDGQETLFVLRKQHAHIDAVLLDVILPHIDGISALGHCKAHYSLPVIVISPEDEPADRDHAVSMGADGFLAKPFSFAQFEEVMKLALSRPPQEQRSNSAKK